MTPERLVHSTMDQRSVGAGQADYAGSGRRSFEFRVWRFTAPVLTAHLRLAQPYPVWLGTLFGELGCIVPGIAGRGDCMFRAI
jgi:hypothetical protein